MVTPYGVRPGELQGAATFRMTPDDAVATGPSGASVSPAAGGLALSLAYWWTHPEDGGRHEGVLLLGTPGEDGAVAAAWIDAWHQPGVVALTGRATGTGGRTGALVSYDYAPGWAWEVELEVAEGVPCLVMRNVVPAGDDRAPGPYEVSRTDWS